MMLYVTNSCDALFIQISSAARVPVNENVERKLTLALREKAEAAKARAMRSSPFTAPKTKSSHAAITNPNSQSAPELSSKTE